MQKLNKTRWHRKDALEAFVAECYGCITNCNCSCNCDGAPFTVQNSINFTPWEGESFWGAFIHGDIGVGDSL